MGGGGGRRGTSRRSRSLSTWPRKLRRRYRVVIVFKFVSLLYLGHLFEIVSLKI